MTQGGLHYGESMTQGGLHYGESMRFQKYFGNNRMQYKDSMFFYVKIISETQLLEYILSAHLREYNLIILWIYLL